MAEDKKYDPEMRGAVYLDTERKNEKAPMATGTIQVSGVELRVAMWAAQVSKNNKKYWPITVEYKQGTKFMLAKIKPENVVVTGASATAVSEVASDATPDAGAGKVEDLPF